jgi:hypothetical protein
MPAAMNEEAGHPQAELSSVRLREDRGWFLKRAVMGVGKFRPKGAQRSKEEVEGTGALEWKLNCAEVSD